MLPKKKKKKSAGVTIEIALNLWINCGGTDIDTMKMASPFIN